MPRPSERSLRRALRCCSRERRAAKAFDAFLRSRGLEDAILAPLRGENRTFGLLVVGDRLGDVSTFVDTDVELFETFAGHASILLENGRLEHSLAEVTQLKEQLRHQAYHDALTGLPNRLNLLEAWSVSSSVARVRVGSPLSRPRPFQGGQRHVGTQRGGRAPRRIRAPLGAAIRVQDLAARIGGDEFAVLVREADADAAVSTARRMLEKIDGTYALGCGDVACHVSVGIAVGAGA